MQKLQSNYTFCGHLPCISGWLLNESCGKAVLLCRGGLNPIAVKLRKTSTVGAECFRPNASTKCYRADSIGPYGGRKRYISIDLTVIGGPPENGSSYVFGQANPAPTTNGNAMGRKSSFKRGRLRNDLSIASLD